MTRLVYDPAENWNMYQKAVVDLVDNNKKAKPAKRRGRKATDPRFL